MPEDAPLRYRMPPILQAGHSPTGPKSAGVMGPLYAHRRHDRGRRADRARGRAGSSRPRPAARGARWPRCAWCRTKLPIFSTACRVAITSRSLRRNTWSMRYGDCKAKTLLLLAMLREMGIEAEAVAVASSTGDAVPGMLPMPGAFDMSSSTRSRRHDYWLDGTSSGASMQVARKCRRSGGAAADRGGRRPAGDGAAAPGGVRTGRHHHHRPAGRARRALALRGRMGR